MSQYPAPKGSQVYGNKETNANKKNVGCLNTQPLKEARSTAEKAYVRWFHLRCLNTQPLKEARSTDKRHPMHVRFEKSQYPAPKGSQVYLQQSNQPPEADT